VPKRSWRPPRPQLRQHWLELGLDHEIQLARRDAEHQVADGAAHQVHVARRVLEPRDQPRAGKAPRSVEK